MAEQISLFDGDSQFKITKPIRLIELFGGYGSQALALKYLGVPFEHYCLSEWAIKSIQAYKDLHCSGDSTDYSYGKSLQEIRQWLSGRISSDYSTPLTDKQIERLPENKARTIYNNMKATKNLGSIAKIKGEDLQIKETNKYDYILTYSFPCFTADNLVLTRNGYKRICDINYGDFVLSHDNKYHKVINVFDNGRHNIYKINAMGIDEIKTTLNHKFYVREKYYKGHKRNRTFKEPTWKELKEITYHLDKLDWHYNIYKERTVLKIHISKKALSDFASQFGRGAGIPHAQLIVADIPYNLGNNAYASNPMWYKGGDNKNGESHLAGKSFFDTDNDFKINNFFDFCTRYMKKEPKKAGERGRSSDAPAMLIFCAFEQIFFVIEQGKKHGLMHSYPLVFIKNHSAQVLKANMKIVGATEYAVVLYREKLPKFRNIDENGKNHMIFNWFEWKRDGIEIPKIHPTQKPVNLLKRLIEIFTDKGDVVIDPCAGSGSTLRACAEIGRSCYGFEIKKNFYNDAKEKMLKLPPRQNSIFEI